MSELSGKRVVVVGLGTSGLAAARLCLGRGARVVLTDRRASVPEAEVLRARGAELALGGHAGAGLSAADLVVLSPGVPSFPELEEAEERGVEVIGEVELAVRAMKHPAPIVAVGGTNGKSTVTTLLGAILAEGGRSVFVGGNLGDPLSDHADERFDLVVLEVSSFQMERVDTFAPRASLLLNLSPDHLDRYPSEEAYARAKGNAFLRQGPADLVVVPHGDEPCLRQARRGKGRVVTFGREDGSDVLVTDAEIRHVALGMSLPRSAILLQGGHNALNVAAALAVAVDLGVSREALLSVLGRFGGLPHRMVLVGEIGRVRFYDDSKGTNVGASVTALEGLVEDRAVLVAGGKDKGGSYAPLVAALRRKGRAAVLLGEAAPLLREAIGDAVPTEVVTTLDEAVRRAHAVARPGDAVLLSPACSSFDMFRDYKHRGEEFERAVRELSAERGGGA